MEKATSRFRGYSWTDIELAKEQVATGAVSQEEMDVKFPNWREEEAAVRQAMAALAAVRKGMFERTETLLADIARSPALQVHKQLSELAKGPAFDFMKQLEQSGKVLDGIISNSVASAVNLRAIAQGIESVKPQPEPFLGPFKSGEEYGLERVENRIAGLVEVALEGANHTADLARWSKENLLQTTALLRAVDALHATTRVGIQENDKTQKEVVRLNRHLVALTGVIVVLTFVLAIPLLSDFLHWSEPIRSWLLETLR